MTDAWAAAVADRYQVVRAEDGKPRVIGQGGMATVYLALDLRHRRKVALKVLRPDTAAAVGPQRFLHEVQVTASLQHPHIVGLIDSGLLEVEGEPTLLYYVMPFVDGESLRQKLTREIQLPLEEAFSITRAVASALDYAHRHGVVHRDIKPENILLHEGQALVADFGIALALDAAGGGRLTETGIALGTPQYMSPEQSLGQRDVTARADVYALGCVLYEMLAGEPPFTGPTAQAILAKASQESPRPIRASRPSVPVEVDTAIGKALAKLPADRFATAAELVAGLVAVPVLAPIPGSEDGATRTFRPREVLWAGALAIAATAAIWGWLRPSRPATIESVKQFEIVLPPDVPAREILGSRIAISPDGKNLAYLGITDGVRRLFLRPMGQTAAKPISGTDGASIPFFSWDGKWLGFMAGGVMKKVSVAGGAPVIIATIPGPVEDAAWGESDLIVYAPLSDANALYRVSAAGGEPSVITYPDKVSSGKSAVYAPSFLPGGDAILALFDRNSLVETRVVSVFDGAQTPVVAGGYAATYGGSNLIVYAQGGGLFAARLHQGDWRVVGSPKPLYVVPNGALARPEFAVSREGTLAYLPMASSATHLVLVDRQGRVQPLTRDASDYRSPRFSPDGAEVVVGVAHEAESDLWLYGVTGPTVSRLTFSGRASNPAWALDGHTIAYEQGSGGIWLAQRDQPGAGRPLLTSSTIFLPDSWTPDGRWLLANEQDGHFSLVPRDTTLKPHRLWDRSAYQLHSAISPDGKWVAYSSNESGQWEVFVDEFPGPGSRFQVSLAGGLMPVWNRNGKELFYRSGNRLYVAGVTTGATFAVIDRSVLFEAPELRSPHIERDYDVSPDGRHFVMLRRDDPLEKLVIVLNWPAELPTAKSK